MMGTSTRTGRLLGGWDQTTVARIGNHAYERKAGGLFRAHFSYVATFLRTDFKGTVRALLEAYDELPEPTEAEIEERFRLLEAQRPG